MPTLVLIQHLEQACCDDIRSNVRVMVIWLVILHIPGSAMPPLRAASTFRGQRPWCCGWATRLSVGRRWKWCCWVATIGGTIVRLRAHAVMLFMIQISQNPGQCLLHSSQKFQQLALRNANATIG